MALRAPTILMVSKPLAKPFNDATKNLVRDIVTAVPERRFHVLSQGDFSFGLRNVREEKIALEQPGWRPPYWREFSTFLRLIKPDGCGVYHFFFTPTVLSARMVSLAIALKPRQPILQTLCSAPAAELPLKTLLFGDTIVTTSEHTRQRLIAQGIANVRAILPGVALPEHLPSREQRLATRRSLGLPEEATLALYAGDYEFSNGAQTVVAALPQAMKSPRLHVVLCCRAKTPRAAEVRDALVAQVAAMGLASCVSFLAPQADLLPLMAACDMLLLPPDSLQAKMDIPLVVLEAMALGLPLILSSLPSLLEAATDKVEALIVPPGDPAALAQALEGLAGDSALAARLGAAGRERVRGQFSLERLGAEHLSLYNEVAG